MPSSHGSKAEVIANGYVLTPYLNNASPAGSRDSAEATTFGNTSKVYVPGLKDTTLALAGIHDGDVGAVDEVLSSALLGAGTGFASYFPFGAALGSLAYSLPTIETSYDVNSDVGNVNQISASLQAGVNGRYARGIVSHIMQVEGAGGNSTGLDNTVVSTTNGGGVVLHAVAAASLNVKLQDSADNTTWADVTGFITVASGRASVRLEAAGLTIRRYTRVLWTGTGTFLTVTERY